jgi:hypothetical protein
LDTVDSIERENHCHETGGILSHILSPEVKRNYLNWSRKDWTKPAEKLVECERFPSDERLVIAPSVNPFLQDQGGAGLLDKHQKECDGNKMFHLFFKL